MSRLLFSLLLLSFACSGPEAAKEPDFGSMTEGELRAEFDSINGLLRKDANNAGLYNLRSKLYQALADYQAAMADIDRALRLMPGEAEYYFRKGQLFILVKDIRQAENALTTCAKLDPEKSDCRLTLAELYFYSTPFFQLSL